MLYFFQAHLHTYTCTIFIIFSTGEDAGQHAEDAGEVAGQHAEDAGEDAGEHADDMNVCPKGTDR